MAFNYQNWLTVFKEHYNRQGVAYSDAAAAPYLVRIEAGPPGLRWRVIGIHHLTPEENRGGRNIYLAALDEQGKIIPNYWVGWKWEGQKPNERADPVRLDKPASEPPGNISVGWGQTVTCWVLGQNRDSQDHTDKVANLHTRHPDQPGSGGENWNSGGHHSFFVAWQRLGAEPISEPPEEVETPPPTGGPEYKTWTLPLVSKGDEVAVSLSVKVKRW